MEVLKHGKNYTTVTCPRCDCTLGYSGKDVNAFNTCEKINGKIYDIKQYYVRCIECGEMLILNNTVNEVTDTQEEGA